MIRKDKTNIRKPVYIFFFLLCFSVSLEFTACKDSNTGPNQDIVFPASNVSYSKHVGPLFQQKCALSCHSSSTPSQLNPTGLNLSYPGYYDILINWPNLIFPGDSTIGTLVQHLNGTLVPMPPPNSPQLTLNQKTGVKIWIKEGALQN